jgi:hypothetical protein
MKEILLKAKFVIYFTSSYCSAGRIARELWWTNQDISPANIIPPRFSMLIYHLGIKQ